MQQQSEPWITTSTSTAHLKPCAAQASAAGKAILCGEHAVVYGATAVALPLCSHKMQVSLELSPSPTTSQITMTLGGRPVSDNIAAVVKDALSLLGLPPFALIVKGKSLLPIGAGLGSSATLCVVILRAISSSLGLNLDAEQIALAANQLERRFHGKPSGLDTSVVAYEQVISFRKNSTPKLLAVKPPWRFALVDSQIRSSTLAMIRLAEPYFQGAQGEGRLREFDQLSLQAGEGLTTGDIQLVQDAMTVSGAMLKDAGVVPAGVEHVIATCKAAGALSAKVTGAGGGGAVLALLPPHGYEPIMSTIAECLPGHAMFTTEL